MKHNRLQVLEGPFAQRTKLHVMSSYKVSVEGTTFQHRYGTLVVGGEVLIQDGQVDLKKVTVLTCPDGWTGRWQTIDPQKVAESKAKTKTFPRVNLGDVNLRLKYPPTTDAFDLCYERQGYKLFRFWRHAGNKAPSGEFLCHTHVQAVRLRVGRSVFTFEELDDATAPAALVDLDAMPALETPPLDDSLPALEPNGIPTETTLL